MVFGFDPDDDDTSELERTVKNTDFDDDEFWNAYESQPNPNTPKLRYHALLSDKAHYDLLQRIDFSDLEYSVSD